MLPAASLTWREIIRFLRQPSRVLGGLATPILFWILLGSGLGRSFRAPAACGPEGYLAYAFTGTVVMIVLFTSIFSTISIIQDRAEGFLQSVLASPAPRSSIVAGKVAGATLLALGQAALFVLLAPTIGLPLTLAKAGAILGALVLVSWGLSGLGFVVAWSMDSTQGFHSIMNLVLLPMWILSGALFPASGAPVWLRTVMAANPLTYGVALLRHALEGGARTDEGIPPVGLSVVLTTAFTLAMMAASTWLACRPAKGSKV
jgi:ABC-2 type transport system permease protein